MTFISGINPLVLIVGFIVILILLILIVSHWLKNNSIKKFKLRWFLLAFGLINLFLIIIVVLNSVWITGATLLFFSLPLIIFTILLFTRIWRSNAMVFTGLFTALFVGFFLLVYILYNTGLKAILIPLIIFLLAVFSVYLGIKEKKKPIVLENRFLIKRVFLSENNKLTRFARAIIGFVALVLVILIVNYFFPFGSTIVLESPVNSEFPEFGYFKVDYKMKPIFYPSFLSSLVGNFAITESKVFLDEKEISKDINVCDLNIGKHSLSIEATNSRGDFAEYSKDIFVKSSVDLDNKNLLVKGTDNSNIDIELQELSISNKEFDYSVEKDYSFTKLKVLTDEDVALERNLHYVYSDEYSELSRFIFIQYVEFQNMIPYQINYKKLLFKNKKKQTQEINLYCDN